VYVDGLGIPLHIPLVPGAGGRGARLSRPQRWMAALAPAEDGLPYWSVSLGCPHLIRTVPRVPWDDDDPNVEDDDSENHAYEDVGRFFEARPIGPELLPADPYAHLDPISAAHHRAQDKKEASSRSSSLLGLAFR